MWPTRCVVGGLAVTRSPRRVGSIANDLMPEAVVDVARSRRQRMAAHLTTGTWRGSPAGAVARPFSTRWP